MQPEVLKTSDFRMMVREFKREVRTLAKRLHWRDFSLRSWEAFCPDEPNVGGVVLVVLAENIGFLWELDPSTGFWHEALDDNTCYLMPRDPAIQDRVHAFFRRRQLARSHRWEEKLLPPFTLESLAEHPEDLEDLDPGVACSLIRRVLQTLGHSVLPETGSSDQLWASAEHESDSGTTRIHLDLHRRRQVPASALERLQRETSDSASRDRGLYLTRNGLSEEAGQVMAQLDLVEVAGPEKIAEWCRQALQRWRNPWDLIDSALSAAPRDPRQWPDRAQGRVGTIWVSNCGVRITATAFGLAIEEPGHGLVLATLRSRCCTETGEPAPQRQEGYEAPEVGKEGAIPSGCHGPEVLWTRDVHNTWGRECETWGQSGNARYWHLWDGQPRWFDLKD
jgi:hypothetical protein